MNKIAIAFSTKDRVELSRRTVEPLLQPGRFDLFWSDGSDTAEGTRLPTRYNFKYMSGNVRGGADAAIVFNLTTMLNHPNNYDYVGLVENDVLLDKDWFEPTMSLFDRGSFDGLEVGAVSARAYEDRILCQRGGYALMHNLGAGMVIFTRAAAQLILKHFRTTFTTENRAVFCHLTGLDIGRWWAFGPSEHWLCADWAFDKVLAAHGLASLALTPAKVEMIGQVPPLAEQGLKLVEAPVERFRNNDAFAQFVKRTVEIRIGAIGLGVTERPLAPDGSHLIFPHQIAGVGGIYRGDWKLRWSQGFGPFAWEARKVVQEAYNDFVESADNPPSLEVPLYGPATFLVSGGKQGGKVQIVDTQSGFEMTPELPSESQNPAIMQLSVPAQVSSRIVRLVALSPGVTFHGIMTRDPQPLYNSTFDHSVLPPA